MASWQKTVSTPNVSVNSGGGNSNNSFGFNNYSSGLKEIYTGPANRLDRYNQYDTLDKDPVVSSALDILAESCLESDPTTDLPFIINYVDHEESSVTSPVTEAMNKWMYINAFRKRLFHIIRNTLKYGDTFFIRDPETYELHYIDPRNIEKIVIDDENGKEPYSYFVRNISVSLSSKIFTLNASKNSGFHVNNQNTTSALSTSSGATSTEIPAAHVVHLSLNSTGLDYVNWPFAASILERIYKPAKQKELLENAFLIYAIQRAPERRVFYVYTGDLPSHKAMSYVERFKNELHQKRIPSRNGGQGSVIDSTYDPQSILNDFYLPVNAEGQGPRIETLPGNDTLMQGLDNLKYFNDLLVRGLNIPSSYIPTSGEDSSLPYNDGKLGMALMQEFRFSKSCQRLQNLFIDDLDFEFKLFCKKCGIVLEASDFRLSFVEPQSFSEYRQIEKDQANLGNMQSALGIGQMSKRFAMKRFGGMSNEEIAENERLWAEENRQKLKGTVADIELNEFQDISLNNVGVRKPKNDKEETDAII